MKSLLWQYVDFLLSGGYCCSSFRGRRAPEKPLWLAFFSWDCTALTSCSVSTKHDIYHKLHLNLATPHSMEFRISLCTACKHGETNTDVEIIHTCVCGWKNNHTWAAFCFRLQISTNFQAFTGLELHHGVCIFNMYKLIYFFLINSEAKQFIYVYWFFFFASVCSTTSCKQNTTFEVR